MTCPSVRRSIAVLVVLLVLGLATAWAQSDAAPVSHDELTLGVGWQNVALDGNERRFDQYVTPASGVYPSTVDWQRWGVDRLDWDLSLVTPGEPGSAGALSLAWGNRLAADAQYRRSTYYFDFEPTSERSRRWDGSVSLGSAARPGGWFWQAMANETDLEGAPAAGTVDWNQGNVAVLAGLRTHGYVLSLSNSRLNFSDYTGEVFSGDTRTFGFSIANADPGATALALSFNRSVTDLDNPGLPDVETWDACASLSTPLSSVMDLTATATHRKVDQTIVQSAYARQNSTLQLEADYRLRHGTQLRGYWTTADTDYVDGLQANTVSVASNTLGAEIKSRLSPELKWRGRFDRLDNSDRPLYYRVDNTLADSVVWSSLRRADFSLNYTHPTRPWGCAANWQQRSWRNDVQGANNTLSISGLTGWWMGDDNKTSLTGSWQRHSYEMPIMDVATQGGYASRQDCIMLGATYQLTPSSSINATVTETRVEGANVNDGNYVTVGYSREFSANNRARAEMSFGRFTDALDSNLNYNSELFRVEWQRDL